MTPQLRGWWSLNDNPDDLTPTFVLIPLWPPFKGKPSALEGVWGFQNDPLWSVVNPIFCVHRHVGCTYDAKHSSRPWTTGAHKGDPSPGQPVLWKIHGWGVDPGISGQSAAACYNRCAAPRPTQTQNHIVWELLELNWSLWLRMAKGMSTVTQCVHDRARAGTHTSGLLPPPASLCREATVSCTLSSSTAHPRMNALELGTKCRLYPRRCDNHARSLHISQPSVARH